MLIHLTEDLERQRDRFCKLLQQIGGDTGLNSTVQSLSTTQITALSEAVASERLETAAEILQSAKSSIEPESVAHEDQVTEVVGQLQRLLSKLEQTMPDFLRASS